MGCANVAFVEGDAKALPLADGSFDAVVFHTTLCHVPDPEIALGEALRVLRRGGRLAIFDGDYATVTCATGCSDPLQGCAAAMGGVDRVYDRWFARRLPKLVLEAELPRRAPSRPQLRRGSGVGRLHARHRRSRR